MTVSRPSPIILREISPSNRTDFPESSDVPCSRHSEYRLRAHPLRVRQGNLLSRRLAFDAGFILGRADGCDVQFADENVSTLHASVTKEENGWWIEDLGSTNGTFVGRDRVTGKIPLPLRKDVHLGKKGPVLLFDLDSQQAELLPRGPEQRIPRTQVIRRYFEGSSGGRVGERTHPDPRSVQDRPPPVQDQVLGCSWSGHVAPFVAVLAIVQYRARIEQLQKLHATAAEVFYTTKSLELNLAKLRNEVEKTNDLKFKEELKGKGEEQEALQVKYIDFLDELGISRGEALRGGLAHLQGGASFR